MPHLEFGDKVVLPPKILLELQCLKIPTPLLFMIRAADLDMQLEEGVDTCSRQYCSVQEFSAPDGQVFLPYWLMQNLHVLEGGSVMVTSEIKLPRGIYCRFQPETMSFLDLAADVGPKLLMETALRRYSVLSVNSTIVIEYGTVRYYVRVAELKPASVVSLCGDVDLETDFMPPEGSDPKRPSTGKSTASNENTSAQHSAPYPSPVIDGGTVSPDNNLTSAICYGRRLRDGGYVESVLASPTGNTSSTNEIAPRKIPVSSLQKAQQIVRDKQSKTISTEAVATVAAVTDSSALAVQLRSAQKAFSTPGYALGTAVLPQSRNRSSYLMEIAQQNAASNNAQLDSLTPVQTTRLDCSAPSNVHKCTLCLADVSSTNMELHTLRCAKNPAYHKFECLTCHEKILRVNENQHRHCPDCTILCESIESLGEHQREDHTASCKCKFCGAHFTRAELLNHVNNGHCDHALEPCLLYGLAFKKRDMAQHARMCSSRTECCDVCKSYIKITQFDAHKEQCEALTLSKRQDVAPVRPDASPQIKGTNPQSRTKTSNQLAVECVYCLQGGFSSIKAVEHHVLHDCRIATSFTAPEPVQVASTNQEEADQPQAASLEDIEEPHNDEVIRPLLAQGRMRRKGDTSALRSTSSSRSQLTPPGNISSNNQANHLVTSIFLNRRTPPASLPPSTLLSPARQAQQAGKLRKPKPRPNPHLRALPQRTSKLVVTPEGARPSTLGDTADLCISSAGPPPRSRPNRRRPATNLPPPGRLDKLP